MLLNYSVGEDSWVPWAVRRSNQSILKEISPECSLEGLMLKLKLQYFGHLMRRADSLEKTLMQEKIEGRRRRGWQRMRWLDGITDYWTWVWVNSWSWRWIGRPGVLQIMGSQRVRHDWATELNWTELNLLKQVSWEFCARDTDGLKHFDIWGNCVLVASCRSINIQMGPPLALHICHLEFISLDLCPGHACAYALTFFSRQWSPCWLYQTQITFPYSLLL